MGTAEFGQQSADFIKDVFIKRYGANLECKEILGSNVTLSNVREALNSVNTYLSVPGHQAIVYYNGHGDQIPDRNGDEPDGKDEVWRLMGGGIMVDDEISLIFKDINDTSYLWLISDSCSSGTIIDTQLNDRPWMSLTSCNAWQDSLAGIDGGMFTLFGLLPAVSTCNTLREVYAYIRQALDIPTQTPQAEVTREFLWDTPLFTQPPQTLSLRTPVKQHLQRQWLTPLYRLPRAMQEDIVHAKCLDCYRCFGVARQWLHPKTYKPKYPYSSTQLAQIAPLLK